MVTTKLNLLATRFMQQIQDPIFIDPVTNIVTPGQLIRSQTEIENYLGQAMNKYFEQVWEAVKGSQKDFLNVLPELLDSISITYMIGDSVKDLSALTNMFHVFDVSDSYIGTDQIEAWNQVHLTEALSGDNPFYSGNPYKGMIYQKPNLYLFPANLTAIAAFTFNLQFIKLPVDPTTGQFFIINGNYDIPFQINHIAEIADIAVNLFKVDDLQESSGE